MLRRSARIFHQSFASPVNERMMEVMETIWNAFDPKIPAFSGSICCWASDSKWTKNNVKPLRNGTVSHRWNTSVALTISISRNPEAHGSLDRYRAVCSGSL